MHSFVNIYIFVLYYKVKVRCYYHIMLASHKFEYPIFNINRWIDNKFIMDSWKWCNYNLYLVCTIWFVSKEKKVLHSNCKYFISVIFYAIYRANLILFWIWIIKIWYDKQICIYAQQQCGTRIPGKSFKGYVVWCRAVYKGEGVWTPPRLVTSKIFSYAYCVKKKH